MKQPPFVSRRGPGLPAHRCRIALSAALTGVIGAGIVVAGAATPAAATQLCGVNQVSVPESSAGVTTTTYLTPGRSLDLSGSGQIWAGVWFTGTNGPEGWVNLAGAGFPQPAARVYSLLARVNGAWTYVGNGATITNTGTTTEPIQLRINDNVPGNGSGAFTATYTTCDMSDTPSQYTVKQVVARHSGKCLDVTAYSIANGAGIQQWTCLGGKNQQWTARPVGGGYYEIVGRQSGKCLDVTGYSIANGARIQQWTCLTGSNPNQQWRFVPVGGGYYEVVGRQSGKCLDVSGYSTADGAAIQQWTCLGGPNQKFLFE